MIDYYNKFFKRVPKNVRRVTLALTLLVVLLLVSMFFMLKQLEIYRAPALSAEDKVRQIVEKVSYAAVLPSSEVPTVATVSDPSKLVNQPFFINSKAGDQVLIYPIAKRAVLWRPSENKVVEISALTMNGTLATSTSSRK
ncbi:hypothetical protein KW800_00870 [Candidatus Parcubacteria bacterium]|nr:hypothetical protein [Candidatus Parcubacteria bacterium]